MAKSKLAVELELLNGEYLAKIKRTGDATKKFSKTTDSTIGGIKKSWLKLGAAAVVGQKFLEFLKGSVKAASDLQEVTSKFQTVFTGNMNVANKAVMELTKNYAMSTREAREYLAAVQDLLVPMGMNAEAASGMSAEIVKLSADIGSFNNQKTSKVMQDITAALTGSFETMKKYGIVLNETVIKQEALRQKVWDGKGAIDAATKAQVAYSLMVKGSQAAIGDMERTADSYANSMKRMEAASEDAAASIGKSLLPVLTKLSNIATAGFAKITEVFNQSERHSRAMIKLEAMRARIQWDEMSTLEQLAWNRENLSRLLEHELFLEKQIASEGAKREKQEQKKKPTVTGRSGKAAVVKTDPEIMAFATRLDMLQNYHDVKLTAETDTLARERERQNQAADDYKAYLQTKLGMDSVYYKGLQAVASTASVFMAEKNKSLFRFGQALAIAQSWMNTFQGVTKAYAQLGPIGGSIGAAVIIAAGALATRKIASQKPPEFAQGSYNVQTTGPAILHGGEIVAPKTMADSIRSGEADLTAGGGRSTNVYVDGQKLFDVSEGYRDEASQNMGGSGSFPVESAY